MNSQLAAHQNLANAPLRLYADPSIAWLDFHLAARACDHLFGHRAADVDASAARRGGQQASRPRRPDRALDCAQFADATGLEVADREFRIAVLRKRFDRLINDSRFGVETLRQCVEGFGLKYYQAAREFERLSRQFAFRQIAVEVSSAQSDYQRTVGMFTTETSDRVVAA